MRTSLSLWASLASRLLALWACAAMAFAAAPAPEAPKAERTLTEWLARMHDASRQHNYVGTFVVSSPAGALSTARIWHAIDAQRQVEKVEALTGTPRSTFRHNDEVVTFLPERRVVRIERRESLGLFPALFDARNSSIPDFYRARLLGSDRVAGFDADVVQIVPKDLMRYGYRIWSEKKSGLVVKLQTLGAEGEVMEQSAFSELQLNAPLHAGKLARLMVPPEGWRVDRAETIKTTAVDEGWGLKAPVPGFAPMSCYRRRMGSGSDGTMQWVFSDGLASVSLFVETFDPLRHTQEGLLASGATQTLTRRIQDWWVTVVGEVPPQTLRAFAHNLERRR